MSFFKSSHYNPVQIAHNVHQDHLSQLFFLPQTLLEDGGVLHIQPHNGMLDISEPFYMKKQRLFW